MTTKNPAERYSLYRRVAVLTIVFTPPLLLVTQLTMISGFLGDIYRVSGGWLQRLKPVSYFMVRNLIRDTYPAIQLCRHRWQWFDRTGEGEDEDLIVEFQECYEDNTRALEGWAADHGTSFRIEPWYATVFVRAGNGRFLRAAEFDLDEGPFQTTTAHGRYIVRISSDDWRHWNGRVYAIPGDHASLIGRFSHPSDVETAIEATADGLVVNAGHGSLHRFKLGESRDPAKESIAVDDLTSHLEFVKVLTTSNDKKVLFGTERLDVTDRNNGTGTTLSVDVSMYPHYRIATAESCIFTGFRLVRPVSSEHAPLSGDKKISCDLTLGTSGTGWGDRELEVNVQLKELSSRRWSK